MPARLAVTADLHFDVARSRAATEAVARQVNASDADAMLVVGDVATADGEALEEALSLFDAGRPRLFVPGNHELWTKAEPREVRRLLHDELPARVRAAGWHWLPGSPLRLGEAAVVGSLGWYDYSFAVPHLEIPLRFYAAGLSPGAARYLRRSDLEPEAADVSETAAGFLARWNDKRFIRGLEDDVAFLRARIDELRSDLEQVAGAKRVLAAVHVSPLAELLPRVPAGPVPAEKLKFAFARAYLGSGAIGEALLGYGNVSHIYCGHTHVPREEVVDGIACVNIGSTYTEKAFRVVDLAVSDCRP